MEKASYTCLCLCSRPKFANFYRKLLQVDQMDQLLVKVTEMWKEYVLCVILIT